MSEARRLEGVTGIIWSQDGRLSLHGRLPDDRTLPLDKDDIVEVQGVRYWVSGYEISHFRGNPPTFDIRLSPSTLALDPSKPLWYAEPE